MAEHVLTTGKAARRRVVGFQLDYNTTIAAAAVQEQARYAVLKTVQHGHTTISRPVRFKVVSDAASHSVKLLLPGRPHFARGGQITVSTSPPTRATGASGLQFTFFVLPGARGIVS
jgi:hypothetical protein